MNVELKLKLKRNEPNRTQPPLNIIDPTIKHYKIYNIARRHGPMGNRLETILSNQPKCTCLCAMDTVI